MTLTANGGPSGNMWTATAGTHTVQAFVDEVNRMAESNENNNTLSSTLTVGSGSLPDLIVTNVTWSPTTPTVGQPVLFSATIKNQGTAATPDGIVEGILFVVDGAGVTWSANYTSSIAPGSSVTLTANGGPSGNMWTATAGTHTVQAVVDDVNRIAESNENNNTLSSTLTVGSGADTTPPTVSSVVASGAGITNGNGNLNAGKVVTLTVAFSEAVTVNTSGGTPTLALNDGPGGVATYTGGSGSNSLTFSYTVAAGQNTTDLTVTAFNLNGATVRDAAGNNANLAGAVTNPSGILAIDTVAPGVPIIPQVTDDVLPVTGVVANGGSTDDTTPTVRIGLSGTNAAAGDQVQLFNGTSALGSAIVLTSGNISNGFVDVTTAALAQGTYNFNAKITDIAGNTSGASSNYTVTITSGSLPDLIVTNVTWSPTTPTVGQPVLFSATIKNQGTAATPDGIIEGIGFLVDGAGSPGQLIIRVRSPPDRP